MSAKTYTFRAIQSVNGEFEEVAVTMTRETAERQAKRMKVGGDMMCSSAYSLRRVKRNVYQVLVTDNAGGYNKAWDTLDNCLNYIFNR